MTNITVINGHPDPDKKRYCMAIANAYTQAAQQAGHQVQQINIAQLDFPILRNQHESEHGQPNEAIKQAQEAIAAAQHIVIIYPLWLGTMPALLKAFFEQVLRPGFAFEYVENGIPKKLLKGRSARVVITMGMPAFAYKWFFFAHSLRSLERNILKFVGLGPIRTTLIGSIETMGDAKRQEWLKKVADLGKNVR